VRVNEDDTVAKKLLSITVRGKHKKWCFTLLEDPKYLEEWREDGLEIDEICNSIPKWVVDVGLMQPYIILQDIFNFKFGEAWDGIKHLFAKNKE